MTLLLGVAWAAEPSSPFPPRGVAIGASLVGEALHDSALSAVYRDTALSGEVRASARFVYGLEAGVTFGYQRLGGLELDSAGTPTETPTWIWYAPVSLTLGGSWSIAEVNVFAGMGPSLVFWGEKPKFTNDGGFGGGKPGVLFDAGVRVPLRGFEPSLFHPDRGLRGVDVEAALGYRASFLRTAGCAEAAPCGLDLSAVRLSVGARARF